MRLACVGWCAGRRTAWVLAFLVQRTGGGSAQQPTVWPLAVRPRRSSPRRLSLRHARRPSPLPRPASPLHRRVAHRLLRTFAASVRPSQCSQQGAAPSPPSLALSLSPCAVSSSFHPPCPSLVANGAKEDERCVFALFFQATNSQARSFIADLACCDALMRAPRCLGALKGRCRYPSNVPKTGHCKLTGRGQRHTQAMRASSETTARTQAHSLGGVIVACLVCWEECPSMCGSPPECSAPTARAASLRLHCHRS